MKRDWAISTMDKGRQIRWRTEDWEKNAGPSRNIWRHHAGNVKLLSIFNKKQWASEESLKTVQWGREACGGTRAKFHTGDNQQWAAGLHTNMQKRDCAAQHGKGSGSLSQHLTLPLYDKESRETNDHCCSLKTEALSTGWSKGNKGQERSCHRASGVLLQSEKAGNWGRADLCIETEQRCK